MSMPEETMYHSELKPKHTDTGVGSLFRSPSLRRSSERFQHYTSDCFGDGGLKRSKSTSDQKIELNIIRKWCIYRVPSKLRNVNAAAYTPQLLSIGLFHYGKPEFEAMEKHKIRYSDNFRKRYWEGTGKLSDNQKVVVLKNFINVSKESIINCYAGTIDLENKDTLLDIILVDACFIIELFLRNCEIKDHDKDYILSSPWLRKAIELELILFENQLPYSLLQDLYDHVSPASSSSLPQKEACEHEFAIDIVDKGKPVQAVHSFLELTCKCFKDFSKGKSVKDGKKPASSSSLPQKEAREHEFAIDIVDKAKPVKAVHSFLEITCKFFKDFSKGKSVMDGEKLPKHFTDLVRHFMLPHPREDMTWEDTTKSRYSIRMLTAAGVNFIPGEDHERLVIKIDGSQAAKCVTEKLKLNLACFRSMNLKLTPFCVKDDTECIIRNVMALEQFVYPEKAYVCNYFLMMDKLVDTEEDVDVLVEKKVIVNMLGSNQEVAHLVNKLCDHIMEEKSCYNHICKKLNTRYESSLNRHLVSLKRVYFKDVWTGSATFFGVVLVLLTIVEIIMSFRK